MQYTDQEMLERQNAIAEMRNNLDGWMSLQPAHVKPDYTRMNQQNAGGKQMQAKFAGRCADCGGPIKVGDTIRYDGRAHHAGQNTCDNYREAQRAAQVQSQRQPAQDDVSVSSVPQTTPHASLPDGKWTLQYADGHYRTFRIVTQKADAAFAPGERVVKYLAASDNEDERSYRGFAFLKDDGRLVIWSKFRADSQLAQDAQVLTNVEDAAKAGEAYALASGNCYRCGHTLTVPASLHRGLGPECAKKVLF